MTNERQSFENSKSLIKFKFNRQTVAENTERRMDEERLINEVENYKFLYDKRDPWYHDTVVKNRAWEEIGSFLEVPGNYKKRVSDAS